MGVPRRDLTKSVVEWEDGSSQVFSRTSWAILALTHSRPLLFSAGSLRDQTAHPTKKNGTGFTLVSYGTMNLHAWHNVELTASIPGQPSTTAARNCCCRHVLVSSGTAYELHFHYCANPGRRKHLTAGVCLREWVSGETQHAPLPVPHVAGPDGWRMKLMLFTNQLGADGSSQHC